MRRGSQLFEHSSLSSLSCLASALSRALQQQLANTSSSSSSSDASPVRVAALEKELESVKQQLAQLQATPPSDASEQLEASKEMCAALGEELNGLAAAGEESAALIARLTASGAEYTRTLDKFRQEKVAQSKVVNLARQEAATCRQKAEQAEQALAAQVRQLSGVKLQSDASAKEAQALRAQVATLQSALDELQAAAQSQQREEAELKTKYVQLLNQHTQCEEEIEKLRKIELDSQNT